MGYVKFTRAEGSYTYRKSNDGVNWTTGTFAGPTNSFEMMSESSAPMPINTDIDDGHAWLMRKSWHTMGFRFIKTSGWEGPVAPGGIAQSYTPLPQPSEKSDAQLKIDGTTMIARTTPNTPSADLSVTFAELKREGLPSLIGLDTMKNRTQVLRNAGNEYLNIEFGWKPLVSDLRALATSVKDHEKIWQSYRKGSEKKTRVGYHLEDVKDTRVHAGVSVGPFPSAYPRFLLGHMTEKSVRHTWFSGAFKYYVPEPVDFNDKMSYWSSQASKILGLRLDPEVVWNLAPWSWAVDWFTNFGDVLHNVAALGKDGLVLQYGYAMAEATKETHLVAKDPTVPNSEGYHSFQNKNCKRIPSNPYGFGVDYTSLSARQTAVIAALGLSRT